MTMISSTTINVGCALYYSENYAAAHGIYVESTVGFQETIPTYRKSFCRVCWKRPPLSSGHRRWQSLCDVYYRYL